MTKRPAVLFGVVSMIASSAMATMYSGSLSSASGEIGGLGSWVSPGPTTIAWEVTDLGTYFHYKYTLTVPSHAISHFIVEVSPAAESGDFSNLAGSFGGAWEIGDFTQSNGNPNIPQPIHGLKFDQTYGTTATFEFDSVRVPVWGDFYAKCGANPPNQAWNTGISTPDPIAPVSNGSIGNHILVPDSQVIPEPATMLMLLLAGAVVAGRKTQG